MSASGDSETTGRWRRIRGRLRTLYERHRRVFWTLHSLWALATGVVIVVLAHHSRGYARWVLAFLVLTWASTLFFSRVVSREKERERRLGQEFVSYLTRVMYQETLFFLLPFYFYSTTLDSLNVVFLALLATLAILACLDLVFDELLRKHRWFGLFFFAAVSFAALNFLLPLIFGVRLEVATALAAVLGLLAAIPLAAPDRDRSRRSIRALVLPTAVGAGLLLWLRAFIPPVPLQLDDLTFARGVRLDTIEPLGALAREATRDEVGPRLAVVATISASQRVEVRVELAWSRNGKEIARSREVEITPHAAGFRVWDAFDPVDGPPPAGDYSVAVRTAGGRLIGRRAIRVIE